MPRLSDWRPAAPRPVHPTHAPRGEIPGVICAPDSACLFHGIPPPAAAGRRGGPRASGFGAGSPRAASPSAARIARKATIDFWRAPGGGSCKTCFESAAARRRRCPWGAPCSYATSRSRSESPRAASPSGPAAHERGGGSSAKCAIQRSLGFWGLLPPAVAACRWGPHVPMPARREAAILCARQPRPRPRSHAMAASCSPCIDGQIRGPSLVHRWAELHRPPADLLLTWALKTMALALYEGGL